MLSFCLFVLPLMSKVEWGDNPVCWWMDMYFCFVCCLDEVFCTQVLLMVGWCQVLDSSGFIGVSSHYLILPRVSSLEKTMAPHSSTLAWKIPWVEESGRLHSMGSWRVGHNRSTSLSLFTFMHWRRKWQPTPVFLPGESQGWGSLVGCCLWGHTESDTMKVT